MGQEEGFYKRRMMGAGVVETEARFAPADFAANVKRATGTGTAVSFPIVTAMTLWEISLVPPGRSISVCATIARTVGRGLRR